ncbi:glycosyltransferase [Paracoccaceae bacterium]|nr:glycosyltransferase [Paracoccaceae bacterium]
MLPRNLKEAVYKFSRVKKEKIIVTGVNLDSGGTLSIFNDALFHLSQNYSEKYKVVAFCSSRNKLRFDGIEYVEFHWSKKSYILRLILEKFLFFYFSKMIKVKLWLSMHDITPRVNATNIVTYVHNPTPFYIFKFRDLYFSPTISFFVLFYKYLYLWDIKKNNFLIVQQAWIKNKFDIFAPSVRKIISKPDISLDLYSNEIETETETIGEKNIFFYPTLSRPFKKVEDFLKIAQLFERLDLANFNFYITLNGRENNYSRWLFNNYGYLHNIVWLGRIEREQVFNLYRKAKCLVFTSHLETWGLPLTEYSVLKKPILAPDLPYVHETLSNYPKLGLYNPYNVMELFDLSLKVANGVTISYSKTKENHVNQRSVVGWKNLLPLILK